MGVRGAISAVVCFALLNTGSAWASSTTLSEEDFSVTQTVYEGLLPAEDSPRVWTGTDLLIGDKITIHWAVRKQTYDDAAFTFHYEFVSGNNQFDNPVSLSGMYTDDRCGNTYTRTSATITCPAVFSTGLDVYAYVTGNAPGPLSVLATVTGEGSDPNPSNNSASLDGSVVCSITGTPGDDTLKGTDAVDSICGGEGNDHLTAVGDEDKLFGQGGNDLFDGSGGRNSGRAVGGDGDDTVSYANADRAITLCVEREDYASNLSAWAPNSLVDIERFIGSPYGDLMEGTNGDDSLFGRGGADRLLGVGGDDNLYGGAGADKFITEDAQPDIIRGGRGDDRARVDGRDVLYSASRVSTRLFSNPCAG